MGFVPSLGACLHRTTQKTCVPQAHIRTAEPYFRALEDGRLGHQDRHKTRIAVVKCRRGFTALRRYSFECLERAECKNGKPPE